MRRWAWRAGAAALLAALVVVLVAGPYRFLLESVTGSAAGELRAAPCLPGEPVETMDSPHIAEAEAEVAEYNSMPPTSGPHFPFSVAPGIYTRTIAEGLTVHAMEHGHVVLQYAPHLPASDVEKLGGLARRYGADVILAPYPPLAHGIALTAWGRIDQLDRFDEARIVDFVEKLRGRYDHGWTTVDDCA